jgi:hypothetical protein
VSCADQVVPLALAIIRKLRHLPPEELFEDVNVPVRPAGLTEGRGELLSLSFLTKRRLRSNLAELHDSKTGFRSAALQVGEALARQHDLTALVQSPGPVLASDSATAGVRFLGRLIDETIAGKERFPPRPSVVLKRTCERFESQIDSRTIEVEWLYPLPFFGLVASVKLSSEVSLRESDDAGLEVLCRSTVGGGISLHHPVLKSALVLVIRRRLSIPFVWSGTETSETVEKVVIALMLSELPVPTPLIWWPEPCEPSLFEIQQGLWSVPPLYTFHRVRLDAQRIKKLRGIYRMVDACPAEVLKSIPMQRAVSAAYRGAPEDRLIDIWIALEALLLTADEKSELQYRLKLRAARILQPTDLALFRKLFSTSYADRSRLLHGVRRPFDQNAMKRLVEISVHLRRILLHAVQTKRLPDPARMDDEMLRRSAVRDRL